MKLEEAQKIIAEECDKIHKSQGSRGSCDVEEDESNGDSVNEYLPSTKNASIHARAFVVENEGGYEGAGEEQFVIVKVEDKELGTAYVKYNGFYNSWAGTEWSDPTLVEPYEEVVIKYREVK